MIYDILDFGVILSFDYFLAVLLSSVIIMIIDFLNWFDYYIIIELIHTCFYRKRRQGLHPKDRAVSRPRYIVYMLGVR